MKYYWLTIAGLGMAMALIFSMMLWAGGII
jgi:hypothetical protein